MEQKQTIADFFLPLLLFYTKYIYFLFLFFLFFLGTKKTHFYYFFTTYWKLGLVGNKYGSCQLSVTKQFSKGSFADPSKGRSPFLSTVRRYNQPVVPHAGRLLRFSAAC